MALFLVSDAVPLVRADSGYVTLTWDLSTDPEVVGYVVEYGQSTGNYISQVDVGNEVPFTVWGLVAGQTYYLAVRAYTATGLLSDYSNEAVGQAKYSDGTTVAPPEAPSGLTAALDASDPSAQVIDLAWTDNSNNEDWFVIERALDGVTFQYLGQTTGPDIRLHADTAVVPATTYTYRVIAQSTNGGASPPSNTASATTADIPNAPPTADASGPYSETVGEPIVFDARGSSDPDGDSLTYNWAFGDGQTGMGAQPSHRYSSEDNFTVTLLVSDGHGGSDSTTTTAHVQAAGVTVDGMSPNAVSQTVGTVDFHITGSGFADGATVTFEHGDGPAPRVKRVTVTNSSQITATVEIRKGGPRRPRRWDVKVTNRDASSGVGSGLLTINP